MRFIQSKTRWFSGLALAGLLSITLSACSGDDENNAASQGAVLVALQPSDAVMASANSYTISILGPNGGDKEVAKVTVDAVTSPTLMKIAAGTYTVTASAFAGDATGTAIAASTGSIKVKRGTTGALALVLRLTTGPALASITASNGAPQNQDVVTLTALLSNAAVTGTTFVWTDDCRGEFESTGGAVVTWTNNWAETCAITVTASGDEGTSSVALPLTTTYKKGTVVPFAGAYCSIFAGDTSWYESVAVAPLYGEGGPAVKAGMAHVYGMDIGPDGNLYMAEREAGRISMVNMATGNIHRIVGTFEGSITMATPPQPATSPAFYWVTDVKALPDGGLLIASLWSQRVWKYYPGAATIGAFAGNGGYGTPAQGALAHQTTFARPFALALAANGDVFVADRSYNRIDRIYASGHTTQVFATSIGSGNMGSGPFGMDIDSNGNLFVANRFGHEIVKYTMNGTRTVIAGTGTIGDGGMQGPVTQTAISNPFGISTGASGKVFFTDSFNHKIRVAGQGGNVRTLVGPGMNPVAGQSGLPNRPIEFPTDVEVSAAGDLYISQKERCEVLKVVGPY